ncbi:dihydrolipoamide dehydrogenase [Candidatus Tenderia electrophaga]|jgi:dihydrolipoamide dehydrogenase|uniref:Dihydrolipoyl dehydrogenase n=1 Tax=Candidatus Tenderia electrophaga TaxID=1748243 RepID=A0A0S2TBH3_9GAMM|nr:dihydrolipoamide dehydrogenase [Candidatus Tenderia electrophaga]
MSDTVEIKVPNIGDFKDVEVIEVLVNPGDSIKEEDSLISVESDKAAMEIPAPQAGVVKELLVSVGDKVSEGSPILKLEAGAAAAAPAEEKQEAASEPKTEAAAPAPQASSYSGDVDLKAELVVLGSGPGGYTAAFRAADLGKQVILIERYDVIGGVCLNVGCIPSKALLHTAQVITEAAEFHHIGVAFNTPEIDLDKLRGHKNKVVGKLTGGLKQLAKKRKVQIVHGYGKFTSPHTIEVEAADGGKQVVGFDNCIIAAGSRVTKLPFIPWDDPRVMDSTDALEIEEVPERLLVVGGGIIGLEMATVYDALGAKVTVVELSPGLIPGADRDVVRPLERRIKKRYENIYLDTKVTAIEPSDKGLVCSFEGKKAPQQDTFDRVLVAIGRQPNGKLIDAEKAGVSVNEQGFIEVDKQQRTNVDHIYAIGDVVGQPMLAHKATHEGKVAAQNIAGEKSFFDARTIPSVAYTDPEVAWMGKTEDQCKAEGMDYTKGSFPWAASGRSLSLGRDEGMTKVLFDADHKIIGAAMTGPNAGELIAEAVLALELGADIEDIALTIHPHPTLSETFNFAAEVAEGTCTDIYVPKRK